MSKKELDRINKRGFKIAKGKRSRMGVAADLGAKVNMRKRAIRIDPDVVKDVGAEWGDKRNGVGFEI